jgi:DNA-binding GntR family transcriptional regulator
MGQAPVSYLDAPLRNIARGPGSKSGRVYDALRSSIISLRLPPGGQIDKVEICDRLGVSRQPVAEALARLAEERLVTVEPQKGTYVTRIRMSDVMEAAFVREALEVATVRRVAPSIDGETIERLKLLIEYQSAAAEAGDTEEFYALDTRFHAAIFERLAFRRAAEVVESARSQTERMRRLLLPTPMRNPNTIVEHKAVLAGLAARDPERAARAMHKHLGKVVKELHKFAAERPELFEP